jgi:hypothetical protein
MVDLSPFLMQGFLTLSEKLITKAVDAGFDSLGSPKYSKSRRIKFDEHLARTFERCTKVKTLLNRESAVELLSIYVAGSFKSQERTLDDVDVIDEIWKHKRAVISGTGGGGKTIFTRYFWISCFIHSRGKVPVYLELRQVNDLTTEDLSSFVFHSIVSDQGSSSRELFDAALKEGRFVFVLDGFDEIKDERRDEIERQLLALCEIGSDCVFLVSGRPDDRFDSWQSFTQYKALPLSRKQVTSLINKVTFDPVIKRKFISRITKDLYKTHTSFLSTPLLATIMLMTFETFADIPEKVHVFYDQAFDTLFAKHDALKEAFNRRLSSKLPIDLFKVQFSYFCLITYDRSEFSFSEGKLLENIRVTKQATALEFDEQGFMKDLLESVCMLRRDGLDIVFSHRTFQEYFTAYCLSRLDRTKAADLLPRYAARDSDNVLSILFDMNRDIVEDCYIIPTYERLKEKMRLYFRAKSVDEMFRLFDQHASIVTIHQRSSASEDTERFPHIFVFDNQGYATLTNTLEDLFLSTFMRNAVRYDRKHKASEVVHLQKLREKLFEHGYYKADSTESSIELFSSGSWKVNDEIRSLVEAWYTNSAIMEYRKNKCKLAMEVCEKMIAARLGRNASLEDILGLNR